MPDPILPEGSSLPAPEYRRQAPVPATYTEVPAYGAPEPGFDPSQGGLLEYWRILKRRKGILLVVASVGALIGFVVTLPQTPIYQAKTSIEILGINQDFLKLGSANPTLESANTYDTVDIPTNVRILQSEALMRRVVTAVEAAVPATPEVTRTSAWRKVLNLPEPEPENARKQAVTYAQGSLRVRAVGTTRVIEMTVDSTNPQVAALFANTLAEEFIQQTLESRFQTTERTGEFLTKQIDDMRVRLEQSEDRLQQYASRAGLVFMDEKTNVSQERLSQIQESLSQAQSDRILKQSRYDIAKSSPPDALADVLNDSSLREYQGKLTELNRQLAELRQTFTDDSAQVRRIAAQIQPLEAAFARQRADILTRIKNDFDEAQRREKLLETDYASQRGVLTGEGEKAIQYNILKREAESNRELYDAILQQLKQASLASALKASNIRVVDPAQIPGGPYKPDVRRNSGLGLMAGLCLAVGFVIFRERADRSIQDPGETQMYLNLPELGVIPQDVATTRVGIKIPARNTASPALASLTSAVWGKTELATLTRKPSPIAESFRATLVSILFSNQNGSRPRVLVITSSSPAEGKSTVVSNLGIAVAEVNQRVLLIDADLRRPRLHDIFGIKNDFGLSDMLRSTEPWSELPEGIVQETSVPGLFLLPSGPSTATATTLLYSQRMPEILHTLRTEFDTILIDTPPMLQIPDARVLGRIVDRVILVVRAKKTTRDAITAAYQRFSEDGTRVLGTILNDWNPNDSNLGYYGYSANYYSRGAYYGDSGRNIQK